MNDRIESLSQTRHLLIACDFNGTLAPIVTSPEQARPLPMMMDDLCAGSRIPGTTIAIFSGIAMADLRRQTSAPPDFWLVGEHGASIAGPGFEQPAENVSLLLEAMAYSVQTTAPRSKGFVLERKRTCIAVHFREAETAEADRVVPILIEHVARPAGLRVLEGKKVVEFLATGHDKATALRTVIRATGATAAVYIGDDQSDEIVFQWLWPDDLGIKIGQPPTWAEFTCESVVDAHSLLCEILLQRARGRSTRHIGSNV